MASTFLNLSTDTTLGGNSPSDSVAVSQKAIKTYVDNNSGGSYTAGTGIDITNDVISVTSPTLTNTATASSSLTIGGQSAVYGNIVNIGKESYCDLQGGTALGDGARVYGRMGTVIGYGSYAFGDCSIAIGSNAIISNTVTKPTIQIGRGTNSEEYTMCIGFGSSTAGDPEYNYKLLDGTTGLIPSARIAIDGTSITVNSSGQLQASGGGSDVEAFTAAEVQTIWESV